jgi:hypothetical protein
LVQGEKESLYHYYGELSRLADKAFNGLGKKIKTKYVDERFMLGLSNDALRTKLMETCKLSNFFDKIFAGKSTLDKALELYEIYGSKKVDIVDISPCLFKVQLADKSEATVLGVKNFLITLGYHPIQVEAIVTKNVSHNCLLRLDFLNKCPTTKIHLEGLQEVINETDEWSQSNNNR